MRFKIRFKLFIFLLLFQLLFISVFMTITHFFLDDVFINAYKRELRENYSDFIVGFEDSSDQDRYIVDFDMGHPVNTTLVDLRSYRVLFSTSPGLVHQDFLPPEQRVSIDSLISEMAIGDSAYLRFSPENMPKDSGLLNYVVKYSDTLIILKERPLGSMVESVGISRHIAFVTAAVMFVLSLIISTVFSYSITGPVLKISRMARAMAELDFSVKLDLKNKDEIGDLGHDMNTISHKLSSLIQELEGKAVSLEKEMDSLTQEKQQLEEKSHTDALTGLANRLKIDKVLNREMRRNRLRGRVFSIIIADVDHFKNVNDTYGHQTGDDVLVKIADILKSGFRRHDTVGRWGGEEFIVILENTDIKIAREKAELLRKKIEVSEFPEVGKITASFGVGEIANGETLEVLIKRVDDALYTAKKTGRNKVEEA